MSPDRPPRVSHIYINYEKLHSRAVASPHYNYHTKVERRELRDFPSDSHYRRNLQQALTLTRERAMARASTTSRAFVKADSRPLQELFGLAAGSACSVVFIAIDFENIPNVQKDLSQNFESEVGVAVLDTEDLSSTSSTELISTYNFATGCSEYQKRARKRFLFGDSVAITQNNLLKSIESLVPRGREVVFVGHDIQNDLRALDKLGFDLSKYNITTLDTQAISGGSPSLSRLLLTLGCLFIKLYCGGNDANFTLKALLLLAARDCVAQPGIERRLATVKRIALSPPPYLIRSQTKTGEVRSFCRKDPQTRAAEKKTKRLQRSRKHQSKLWDSEMQEKIRVERASKKLLIEPFNIEDSCIEVLLIDS
ncbi:polynucleotidyl transferase protein [Rutstroemia sp. NJR-2017a WRK4]|nr:polynucleotidyl transferase protein [Rutstroemia sp. NJR-2017a WRK4]